jgi:DNA-binding XRE family transcriptional regulator
VTGSEQPTRILAISGLSTLRDRRLACGLTQGELADRAGVSRQLVAAVEAGRNTPAVGAALGLARALSTSVEELFSVPPSGPVVVLGGDPRDGVLLKLGRVGTRLIGAELADHGIAGASWAKPDGVFQAGRLRLFPGATPASTVIAGCDPALGVAESMLAGLGAHSLLAASAPSGAALRALDGDRIHAAVVHGPPDELPEPPVPVIRSHLARWQVGLAFPIKLSRHTLEALLSGDLPLVQRDPAAASQQALERARVAAGLSALPPGLQATGHLDAARIAAILGGAAITTEGAARAFGLRFRALEVHVVEIWTAERWHDHSGVNALADLLTTAAFTERVAHFGGYDLARCGQRV